MKTRKRFGQHFLVDEEVVDRIISALRVRAGEQLLEIGPGRGVLSEFLCVEGVAYRAVEIDRDLVALLRARFPGIDLIQADVLRLDVETLLPQPSRVVGNLPYNISTPLLVKLMFHRERIVDMHFMLQWEVVNRLAAEPGTRHWGRLSVLAQTVCSVVSLFDVEPTSFAPPPKVRSAVVRLVPRATLEVDLKALQEVTRVAFGQRRKRLANALQSLELDWSRLPVNPDVRPQDVDLAGYAAMAAQYSEQTRREH